MVFMANRERAQGFATKDIEMRSTLVLAFFAFILNMTGAIMAAELPQGFHEPRPGLYTGGLPDERALREFAGLGVTTVIDLRRDEERAANGTQLPATTLRMRYIALPIADANDLTSDNAKRLKQAIDESEGRVLLHCASGNRVGALLALMVYHEERASPEQAIAFGVDAGLGGLSPEVDARLRAAEASR